MSFYNAVNDRVKRMTVMSITQLADAIGMGRADVSKKLKDKLDFTKKANAKYYDSVIALPFLLMGGSTEESEGGVKSYNYTAEKARSTHHEANIKAINEAILDGDVVKAEDVLEEWSVMTSNWKAKMLGLPSNLVLELSRTNHKPEIMAILKKGISDSFVELIEDGD